jgi:FkbM family methyltransferase
MLRVFGAIVASPSDHWELLSPLHQSGLVLAPLQAPPRQQLDLGLDDEHISEPGADRVRKRRVAHPPVGELDTDRERAATLVGIIPCSAIAISSRSRKNVCSSVGSLPTSSRWKYCVKLRRPMRSSHSSRRAMLVCALDPSMLDSRFSGAQGRMQALAELVHHPDPSQLLYQVGEIAGKQTYLRHGITVGPGDVVCDVGANVGVAAAFFAALCGARRVHCFEPVAPICSVLRENVRRLEACVVHEVGLSDRRGETTITYYPDAAAMSGLYADPARDRELVRAVLFNSGATEAEADARLRNSYEPQTLSCRLETLSAFLREQQLKRVDLLKIDVERAELDVLRGIEEHDWPAIGQVVIEVHDEDGRSAEVARLLERHGFTVASEQDAPMRGTSVRMLYGTRP